MDYREKHYPSIGNVVVAFQDIDFGVTYLLASLLNEDGKTVQAIAGSLRFPEKLKVLQAVANDKISDQALLERLNELVKQLNEAKDQRNSVVHGLWINPVKEVSLGFYKPQIKKGVFNNFLEVKSDDEIKAIVSIVQEAEKQLREYIGELTKRGFIKTKHMPFDVTLTRKRSC
jgi:hypothetical protein